MTARMFFFCLLIAITLLFVDTLAFAQISGSRSQYSDTGNVLAPLDVKVANSHMTITGTAQVRVKPTRLRLIWVVAEEAQTAQLCQEGIEQKIANIRTALQGLGVTNTDVVEDFISAIPRFEYLVEEQEGEKMLVETQTGYRMQSNLHVAVDSDEKALEVIAAVFKVNDAQLVGVDYTADLKDPKQKALRQALEAAKAKAELLLGSLYEHIPPVINVQEQTTVFFPDTMYDSFENVAREDVTSRYRSNMRRINRYRPKNTYYQGLTRAADTKSYDLPMHPEIIIESKVAIYYRSPAADANKSLGDSE